MPTFFRKTRLQGDLIILGKPDTKGEHTQSLSDVDLVYPAETVLSRYAFSQALARSTALSALEVGLDDYLSSMATLPHILVQTGKPGLGRKALIKKLGELMKFRQSLNLNRENYLDIPDFYWTEPELECKCFIRRRNMIFIFVSALPWYEHGVGD